MTDDSVSRYFEFYRVNFNGEKKPTEWFLGSNLQCCLHATVLLTVKYSAKLNKYILLVRVICEKYWFRGQEKFPSPLRRFGKFASPLNRYFSQIIRTNRIYLYNIWRRKYTGIPLKRETEQKRNEICEERCETKRNLHSKDFSRFN